MDGARPGFTGDMQEAIGSMFAGGVASMSQNGAIGDPTQSSAEHGERYWATVVDLALEQVSRGS